MQRASKPLVAAARTFSAVALTDAQAFSTSAPSRAGVARLTLVGRLGKDAEATESKTGNANVKLLLATSRPGQNGEELTSWHNVTVYDKAAQIPFIASLPKGSLVAVEADYFHDVSKKDDGTYDTRITLLTRDVQVLSAPKKDGDAPASSREIH